MVHMTCQNIDLSFWDTMYIYTHMYRVNVCVCVYIYIYIHTHTQPVAYPGILFRWGSTNLVEDRENGDLGAVAPYQGF